MINIVTQFYKITLLSDNLHITNLLVCIFYLCVLGLHSSGGKHCIQEFCFICFGEHKCCLCFTILKNIKGKPVWSTGHASFVLRAFINVRRQAAWKSARDKYFTIQCILWFSVTPLVFRLRGTYTGDNEWNELLEENPVDGCAGCVCPNVSLVSPRRTDSCCFQEQCLKHGQNLNKRRMSERLSDSWTHKPSRLNVSFWVGGLRLTYVLFVLFRLINV